MAVETLTPKDSAPGAANPAALTVEQLAKLLNMPVDRVQRHVDAGAPVAADGTLNLVHYAAWLNLRLKENDGD